MSTAQAPGKATLCPRCAQPLTDAAGLGWCPGCGYCRTLEETPAHEPGTLQTAIQADTPKEEYRIPNWIWPLVVGVALIVNGTILANRKIIDTPFQRALWASLQIAGGLLILFVGQFIALLRLAHQDEKLSFKDAIMPFRLYGAVFKSLPKCASSVWCLGWGLAVIICAFVFIGGLGHWFSYVKSNKDKQSPPPFKRPA
jgi:hypothetical protein